MKGRTRESQKPKTESTPSLGQSCTPSQKECQQGLMMIVKVSQFIVSYFQWSFCRIFAHALSEWPSQLVRD